ncbi:Translin-associated protein X [Porphyridium purpureum]|uniref:Translin-associated protein X n=1 Tax=Porphyridium purpureum TaxID=35688 RepID=A0A5J4Z315_PORPP|nr:Translin-associated protein X [Porphyridium purpureum]|eukprot:POR3895..scf295_1
MMTRPTGRGEKDRHAQKRARVEDGSGAAAAEGSRGTQTPKGAYADMFASIGAEMDAFNYQRERLVQASRTVTMKSKHGIFGLHRIAPKLLAVTAATTPDLSLMDDSDGAKKEIVEMILTKIAGELAQDTILYYRLHRAFSPGIQEFLEFVLFAHYLQTRTLMSLSAAQQMLDDAHDHWLASLQMEAEESNEQGTEETGSKIQGIVSPQKFTIDVGDYVLAVGDLTGEVMRLAVGAVATGDLETPHHILPFLRSLHSKFDSFLKNNVSPVTAWPKDILHKSEELKRSLIKVERVCYEMHIRKSEFGSIDPVHLKRLMEQEELEAGGN